ncbi:hypothetical protein AB0C76_37995 [Kitasatospora sp. NPDC048722]|uniref:hypothetical protein n=1 Tax=Kitasatospora sp. NPDC048722 TaxID=3155639 RepID=UPI0033FFC5D7
MGREITDLLHRMPGEITGSARVAGHDDEKAAHLLTVVLLIVGAQVMSYLGVTAARRFQYGPVGLQSAVLLRPTAKTGDRGGRPALWSKA